MTMPTKIIAKAAELLDERGWCQGTSVDHAGRMCMHGALSEAWKMLDNHHIQTILDAIHIVNDSIGLSGVNDDSVVSWNDARGRTYAEVRAELVRAAEWK